MTFIKIVACSFLALMLSSPAWADEPTGKGTIAETMNVGPYVYLRLAENDLWLAASPTELNVGDKIEYSGGSLMKNFYSSKLDRTFEDIIFAQSLWVTEPATPSEQIAAAHANAKLSSENIVNVQTPSPGEITALEGESTVATILSGYPDNAGSQTSLRARVMKVSENIMGRHWITLEDGSGGNLIATTQQSVNLGDLVIASGTIANDVELGYGYEYKVLLEEASFEVE